MSYAFSLDPAFAENQYNDAVRQNTSEPPPESRGLLDVVEQDLLNPVTRATAGQGAVMLGLAGSLPFQGIDKVAGTELTDLWMKEVVDPAVTWEKSLKPNPRTTNMAENVLDGVLSFLPSAILTGPIGAGVLPGITEVAENVQEGKSLETSFKMGGTTALANAIGTALPASFISKSLPLSAVTQRVGTGIAANVGMGAIERETKHNILANAGYQEQANQYQAWDKTGMAIDAIFGGAFGRYEAFRRAEADAKLFAPKQEQIDAALTVNQARHASELAPGIPTTPAAANAHADALNAHIDALVRGEESPASALINRQAEIPEDLISTAGNRLSRGDRQALDRELADIEFKLSRLDQQEGYRKQDFIDAVREENPRMPARKQAALAEQRAAEAQAEGRKDIEAMRDRLLEQRNADDQARAAHAEISRIEQQHLLDHGFIEHPEAKARQERVQNVLDEIAPRREGGLRLVQDEPVAAEVPQPVSESVRPEIAGNSAVSVDGRPAGAISEKTTIAESPFDLASLGVLERTPKQVNNVIHAPHSIELSKIIPFIGANKKLPEMLKRFANWIPTFQGGKNKMAFAATDKIQKFFGQAADKITVIDDWFGGSGGWGGYLALSTFKNVALIRIHEFNPDRLEKIKLFHDRGNEVADLFKSAEVKPYIEKLIAAVEKSGTFSGSGITARIDDAFQRKSSRADAKAIDNEMLSAITAAMKDQGEASYGKYGKGASARHAVEDLIKRVSENAAGSHAMFQMLKQRGVKIEYISGDSYSAQHIPGDHVLSIVDPPYYGTKGYNGEKIVGMDTYNQTRQLINRLINDKNSLIYTDEAWFDKGISQSKKDKKTGVVTYGPDHGKSVVLKDMNELRDGLDARGQLLSIRNALDAFFRTPIDSRIETVGLYNGTNKSNHSQSNIGRTSGTGNSEAARPSIGESGELPVRPANRGMAARGDVSPGAVSATPGKVTPELNAARQSISERGDKVINIENDDGTVTTISAEEALRMVDDEAAMAEQSEVTMSEAIACFFRNGDKV